MEYGNVKEQKNLHYGHPNIGLRIRESHHIRENEAQGKEDHENGIQHVHTDQPFTGAFFHEKIVQHHRRHPNETDTSEGHVEGAKLGIVDVNVLVVISRQRADEGYAQADGNEEKVKADEAGTIRLVALFLLYRGGVTGEQFHR